MTDLQLGDVLPMKSMRVVIQNGDGWLDYKAGKGKQFVLLLLGVEDVKGPQKIDANGTLKALGWQPPAKAE